MIPLVSAKQILCPGDSRQIMLRMYVDEVGNADLNASQDPNHRYLSLTGVVFELDYMAGWWRLSWRR